MTSLHYLVDDILLLVAELFTAEADINSLSQTCRRFYILPDPLLYRLHVREHSSWALL